MKSNITKSLSLVLAGLLQFMPLIRSALPAAESFSSPTGSLILRWFAGAVALFGYHAISRASSVAISPPTALVGVPYSGTVTYSGGHAGSVNSMTVSNTCLGSFTLAPGLTMTYSGGNTATLSGTPTGAIGTVPLTVKVWDYSGCAGGDTDTRSTSLIIQNSGGSATAPSITVSPQNVVAQVGSTVILSGGATGNPVPSYYWKQGITVIPGATNNTLTLPSIQFTNAGLYTLVASNSQNIAQATCYLTVVLTPGSNILAYQYTNYVVAGTPTTLTTLITNVPAASNSYAWTFDLGQTIPGQTNNTFSLTSAQAIPSKSGTYTVLFSSAVGTNVIVNSNQYYSYWSFGYLPFITNQPTGLSVSPGANATFSATIGGSTNTVLLYQNQTNLVAVQALTFGPTSATATTNISFTLTNVTAANAGTYTIVVTNSWGSATSSNAVLNVGSALSVSAPQSQTNYAGSSVSLSVTPTGTAPFAYQWQKGGANLANGGNLAGATTNALLIAPAAVANSGNYQVVVTNSSGSVTSSVAVVSIVPAPQFGLSARPGSVTLSAAGGIVGSNYVVQVSTNLSNTAGWTPIFTNVVPAGGVITFTDTNSTAAGRFYRVAFP